MPHRRHWLALLGLLSGCGVSGFVPRADGSAESKDLAGADLSTSQEPDLATAADATVPDDLAAPAVWSTVASGTNLALHVAAGPGANNIVIVGQNGIILRSTDGGQTWKGLPNMGVMTDLNGVWCTPAGDFHAVGVGGVILRSVDGMTWTPQNSGTQVQLNLVWGTGNDLFVVGEGGTILHSVNAGASWTAQTSNSVASLSGIGGTGLNDLFVVGGGGLILRSINGGATWTQQASGSTKALYVVSSVGGVVLVVGAGGTILRSTNGGANWATIASGVAVGLGGIWQDGAGHGFVVGGSGTILQTNDHGQTWAPDASGTATSIWTVDAIPNAGLIAPGANGLILRHP